MSKPQIPDSKMVDHFELRSTPVQTTGSYLRRYRYIHERSSHRLPTALERAAVSKNPQTRTQPQPQAQALKTSKPPPHYYNHPTTDIQLQPMEVFDHDQPMEGRSQKYTRYNWCSPFAAYYRSTPCGLH